MEELDKQHHHCNELSMKVKENDNIALKIDLVEKQKEELLIQLEAAQGTINSLSSQVN